jgi:zinc protease
VDPAESQKLVELHWGHWPKAEPIATVPPAPPLNGPKDVLVEWPSATLPVLQMAWRAPAYSDTTPASATLDILSYLYFSPTSEIYEDLVLTEQSCDIFAGTYADHLDPYLYIVTARVKDTSLVERVKERVAKTLLKMQTDLIDASELETVKSHLRYAFAMRMDHTDGIAGLLARYVALKRTPETINRLFEQYAAITAEDLRATARIVFKDSNRVTALLRTAA